MTVVVRPRGQFANLLAKLRKECHSCNSFSPPDEDFADFETDFADFESRRSQLNDNQTSINGFSTSVVAPERCLIGGMRQIENNRSQHLSFENLTKCRELNEGSEGYASVTVAKSAA